ncbi:MAG: aminotransferase class V-fold PLP-dependent enzyme [Gemmataceae bacterium]
MTSRNVYLNHAGTSWPKPPSVLAAVGDFLQTSPDQWPDRFEKAHHAVAEFFHISNPSRLLLTPGGTSALGVAVADHLWSSSDRVLTSSLEHHALYRPLTKLKDQGVEIVALPRTPTEFVVLEVLERELRAGKVRMVALTAACNVTGELLTIQEVIVLARHYGAMTLIDAAQIVGWWDLDIPRLGADMVAFAGHKGLHAPWGVGGLYVSPELILNTPAATCEKPPDGNATFCSPMPGYCDVGSVDQAALAGLRSAVEWLGLPEQEDRFRRCCELAEQLRDVVRNLAGATIHGSQDSSRQMPTVAFTLGGTSGLKPSELAKKLAGQGIVVSGGLQCAPLAHETLGTAPEGLVRMSVGLSNTQDDVEYVSEVLRSL